MTVKRNESGEMVARMSMRDLAAVLALMGGGLGFLWHQNASIYNAIGELKNDTATFRAVAEQHEKRIDKLESKQR